MQLQDQLKEIYPSAKEPLFRRLMGAEELSYLREKKSIIGFELDLERTQLLNGFTLIAIQKHTIYGYRSDQSEEPRLVLFPPLDKLFDNEFDLLKLYVIKKEFTDAAFQGKIIGSGRFDTLVRDLTPPEKEVDIPSGISEKMVAHMEKIRDQEALLNAPYDVEDVPVQVKETGHKITPKPKVEAPPEEIPEESPYDDGLNDFDQMDEPWDEASYDQFEDQSSTYDDFEEEYDDKPSELFYENTEQPEAEREPEEQVITEDPRTTKLKSQTFESLSDVSDYVSNQLGIPKALSVQVVNKALQSGVDPKYRIDLAVKLFAKLFDEKKV